jgi:hypothetical protein
LFKGKIIQWLFDESNLHKLYNKFDIKSIPQLREKLVAQESLDSMYKYELYILSDIIGYKIIVVNQYDETIIDSKSDIKNSIIIKYEIYNNIITKFYAIYYIE